MPSPCRGGRGGPSSCSPAGSRQFLLAVPLSTAAVSHGSVTLAAPARIPSGLPLPGLIRDWHPSLVGWQGSKKLLLSALEKDGEEGITSPCAGWPPGSGSSDTSPHTELAGAFRPPPGGGPRPTPGARISLAVQSTDFSGCLPPHQVASTLN